MCDRGKKDECCEECNASSIESTKNPQSSGILKLPCIHGGRVYQDGEEFTTDQKKAQCISCVCKAGLVLCRLRNCESTQCTSPEEKRCCPFCKDEVLPSEQASPSNPVLVTIMVSDSQSQSGDCSVAGITYSHGSSWHPVIGPFGPMDCVYCTCKHGKIECSRLNCPPLQSLPCQKPLQVPGYCCPVCVGDGISSIQYKQPQLPLHEPPMLTIQHKDTRQVQDTNVEPIILSCLPLQTNTVVFRSHAASSSSAYYQFAFQSALDYSTRLITWTIKDGKVGDFSEQYLSREEFMTLRGTFQFKLQGSTRTKFMEKFIRKAKRLPDRCGGRCSMKIQHLVQVLHLQEIEKRTRCLAQELTFH